jgi:hypothetical protein
MTLLGKVFAILTFCFSLSFFVLSLAVVASHVKWRQRADDAQKQLTSVKTTLERAKQEFAELQANFDRTRVVERGVQSALRTELTSRQQELAELTREVDDLRAKSTEQVQVLGFAQQESVRLTDENAQLKEAYKQTVNDRNQELVALIERSDQLNEMRSQRADLEQTSRELQEQATLYQARFEDAQSTLASMGVRQVPSDLPPDGVNGRVLAVSSDKLVEISIGQDDGLKVGHELDVYRGGTYLGRIRLQRVREDRAVGEIIPSFRRGYIQQGDNVATKFG